MLADTMSLDPCTCSPSPTNPHATLRRAAPDPNVGLPAFCTTPDPCLRCAGTGCTFCGFRGYAQHCERRWVGAVETAGWDVP